METDKKKLTLKEVSTERKFNVGDKVIVLELNYFTNPYHFGKCVKELEVKDATDNHFSLYRKLDPDFSGSNQWDIRHQSHGLPMYGTEKVYHKEKDREEITFLINNAITDYDNFTSNNDSSRISELKALIKSCRTEIESIKYGNGSWKIGFSRLNNKEYKSKVLNQIKKYFNINDLPNE